MRRISLILIMVGVGALVFFSAEVAFAQVPTPTASPTLESTSEPPELVLTATMPSEQVNFACPSGLPVGWLTVTPSWSWWVNCEQCVEGIPTVTLTPTSTPEVTVVPVDYQIHADGSCRGDYYSNTYSLATNTGLQTWGAYSVRSLSCGYITGTRSVFARVTVNYVFTTTYSYQGYSTQLKFKVTEPGVRSFSVLVRPVYSPPGERVTVSGTYVYEGTIVLDYWNSSMSFGSDPARAGELLTGTVSVELLASGEQSDVTPTPSPTSTPSGSYCSVVERDMGDVAWDGVNVGAGTCFVIPPVDLSVPYLPGGGFPGARICVHDLTIADLHVLGAVISLNTIAELLYAAALIMLFFKV